MYKHLDSFVRRLSVRLTLRVERVTTRTSFEIVSRFRTTGVFYSLTGFNSLTGSRRGYHDRRCLESIDSRPGSDPLRPLDLQGPPLPLVPRVPTYRNTTSMSPGTTNSCEQTRSYGNLPRGRGCTLTDGGGGMSRSPGFGGLDVLLLHGL